MYDYNKLMDIAIREANKCLKSDDVPVGALIVKNNKIISKGYNKKEKNKNGIKHAEIIAIEKACKKLKTWHLDECELIVTLEPCMMCCGAAIQTRIKKIVYATSSPKFGFIESVNNINENKNNHKFEIESGFLEKDSADILKKFFKNKR